jgi:hypothetical protein
MPFTRATVEALVDLLISISIYPSPWSLRLSGVRLIG